MTNTQNHASPYRDLFKGWSSKVLGPQPTADQLAVMHGLGLRPGKQALANAMALRADGVSGAQIVIACGAPQLNRMRGLIGAGVVKRDMVPANEQGHTVYKLHLTPKGEAAIKRATENAAKAALEGDAPKAAKPKSAKSAKKAERKAKVKAATVEAPTAPAVTADAPDTAPGNDSPVMNEATTAQA
eukprot:GHVU01136746.1.p1 GENE.GHVU01136746.1~~GHVU01136746.1.p1  ORF type:complete len:186 (-),score=25.95 GHVU01136746.1:907-1464(-)